MITEMVEARPDKDARDQVAHEPYSLLDNTVTSRHFYRTRFKMIKSGKCLEIYEYEYPLLVNHQGGQASVKLTLGESDRQEEYKTRGVHRAKDKIRRLVQNNFDKGGKFLTLTFRDTSKFDIASLSHCNQRLAYFVKKLRLEYPDIRYLSVPEFQKRGAVHYHLILNLPFIPIVELRNLWRYGFLKINRIKYPDAVGAYMGKYIGKNVGDERLEYHRSFMASQNLVQPKVWYGDNVEQFKQKLESLNISPHYSNRYHLELFGVVWYRSYNLYQLPAQKDNYGQ